MLLFPLLFSLFCLQENVRGNWSKFELSWTRRGSDMVNSVEHFYIYKDGEIYATSEMQNFGTQLEPLLVETHIKDGLLVSRSGHGAMEIAPVFEYELAESGNEKLVFADKSIFTRIGISVPTSVEELSNLPHKLSGQALACEESQKVKYGEPRTAFNGISLPKTISTYSSDERLLDEIEILYFGPIRRDKLDIPLEEGGVVVANSNGVLKRILPACIQAVKESCESRLSVTDATPSSMNILIFFRSISLVVGVVMFFFLGKRCLKTFA